MGDTVKKYYEDLEDEEIFSSALAHQQYKKNMSDREIMNAKRGTNVEIMVGTGINVVNDIITPFETKYPKLSKEFKKIQKEQYELFAAKMLDYGLNNVTLGGDIVNNSDDKKFSLTGLTIRLTDKINRLRNLVVSGKNYVKGEGMEDTFIDIANYGIIGMLVGRNRWKK
jgi:imidazole glycerol phosphate synthase subunit HisF